MREVSTVCHRPIASPTLSHKNDGVPATLHTTLQVIQRGIDQRLHIGAQLYVSLRGRIIADIAVGEARGGVAMATDTLMPWLSAGKPLAAAAIAQLWERGRFELDDPVARHIPEFAASGKESVTIRHLLTHTGGFRNAAVNWTPESWEQIIARINAAPLEPSWVPGRKAGYHAASSWYVLGELVRRLDGRTFDRYVRDEILLPAGMDDSWVGMPAEKYAEYGQRIGIMHSAMSGHLRPQRWDVEQYAAVCRPAANARGPIRELGRFYEMLLARGRCPQTGRRIISSQSVEAMTARHRAGMYDHTLRRVVDWGLGFVLNAPGYDKEAAYSFGPHASCRTFGHGGSRSSMGLADPEHALAVAFVFNGMPGEAMHAQRNAAMAAAIYQDLGLASAER